MFNRTPKYYLFFCFLVSGVLVTSACTDSNYYNEKVAAQDLEPSVSSEESTLKQYIIVLDENVSISSAIVVLESYQVQVIKDLKKDRYLIGLKNDPGIEQLQKLVEGSMHIKHIQPNFTYTIE